LQEQESNKGRLDYYELSSVSHGSLMNIMGTRFDMVMVGKNKSASEAIWGEVSAELERLNSMLNRFDKTSEISRINREAFVNSVRVSSEMWSILRSCKHYHSRTFGLFDITLKDFSKVVLSEETSSVAFLQPNVSLDLGGFAKGYAMRKIKKMLIDAEVRHCFVDFGNSAVLGIGHHPYGDSWKVSIENPFNKAQILHETALKDEALSVSGNTPSYTGHIVRPDSGNATQARQLICVTASDPLDAEVLTTALMIADQEEKKQLIRNFEIKEQFEFNL